MEDCSCERGGEGIKYTAATGREMETLMDFMKL